MNPEQQAISARLTWPVYGVTCSSMDEVLCINGVRVIVYPNGKLDILAVDDRRDYALEAEASIRARFGDLILGHVKTYYHNR